jgi:hypothetical protein
MPDAPDAELPIGHDLDLLLQAARAVITGRVRVISQLNIQRRLRVGFVKAWRLLVLLEQEGVIIRSGVGPSGTGLECAVPRRDLDAALVRIRRSASTEAGDG